MALLMDSASLACHVSGGCSQRSPRLKAASPVATVSQSSRRWGNKRHALHASALSSVSSSYMQTLRVRGTSSRPATNKAVPRGIRATAIPAEDERREVWEAPPAWAEYPFGRLVAGVAVLLGLERAAAAGLKAAGSTLPAPVLMLGAIAAFMALGGSAASETYDWMHPAITFFDQWMPLFFVPSISAIALAPLPHGLDLVKSIALLFSSYLVTLWASAKVGTAIRSVLQKLNVGGKGGPGLVPDEEKIERIGNAAKMWTKEAAKAGARVLASAALQSKEAEVQKMAIKGASILGNLAEKIPKPKRLHSMPALPTYTPALLFSTAVALLVPPMMASQPNALALTPGLLLLSVATFNAAKKLPANIKMWLGPTLAAGLAMCSGMALYGLSTGATWQSGIRLYTAGAGGLLGLLIGPAVAALGFKVYSQRALLQQHALDLVLVCLLMAPLQFLATAVLGRVLAAPPLVVSSMIPAHTTLGMALGMAPLLFASPGLIVAGVTIAGTTGISTARTLLDSWKVRDPTTRGLAVGIASHSLGTSALVADEPKSAAVSGLAFALKGAISVVFVSIPAFRQLLLLIGTGQAL